MSYKNKFFAPLSFGVTSLSLILKAVHVRAITKLPYGNFENKRQCALRWNGVARMRKVVPLSYVLSYIPSLLPLSYLLSYTPSLLPLSYVLSYIPS